MRPSGTDCMRSSAGSATSAGGVSTLRRGQRGADARRRWLRVGADGAYQRALEAGTSGGYLRQSVTADNGERGKGRRRQGRGRADLPGRRVDGERGGRREWWRGSRSYRRTRFPGPATGLTPPSALGPPPWTQHTAPVLAAKPVTVPDLAMTMTEPTAVGP